MNNQLIEKIIKSNNLICPELTFENPLLDKNVAKSLSKSFVKILNLSQQNLKVNNNLRRSILENIRKMCQIEPQNHIPVDENITELLKKIYNKKITDLSTEISESTDKHLDAFLLRNIKDLNISSSYSSSLNPEILQALNNLDKNAIHMSTLSQDIIHWNSTDNKNINILKQLWSNENCNTEDISVKLKPDIEKQLLEICHSILTETELNIGDLFEMNMSLINIVKRSSDSSNCFQICCGILNYLFVITNFNTMIQTFIEMFVKNVKQNCSHLTISVLYPVQVSHIVVLLDIDIEVLPEPLQNDYITSAVKYLCKLHSESESDLIMLLSHYPNWFDIYFNKRNST